MSETVYVLTCRDGDGYMTLESVWRDGEKAKASIKGADWTRTRSIFDPPGSWCATDPEDPDSTYYLSEMSIEDGA